MSLDYVKGGAAAPTAARAGTNRWYMLGLLTLIFAANYLDRQILGIMRTAIVAPVDQGGLGISDAEFGLLAGLGFTIFYTLFGFPLAWMAERYDRIKLIAACLALFSLMTAACGLAGGFLSLFIIRFFVAVGEAGTNPISQTIIADLFSAKERLTAAAIYAAGVNLGLLLANFGGGWLLELVGWRWTFAAVGLPGLILALLALVTLRDPPRGKADGVAATATSARPEPFLPGALRLLSRPSYVFIALGALILALAGTGGVIYVPSYFIRVHGLSPGETGTLIGLVVGLGGLIGTIAGGYVADRLGSRDPRWYGWLIGGLVLFNLPFSLFGYLAADVVTGALLLSVPFILGNAFLGATYGLAQTLAPLRLRGLSAALMLLAINLLGSGLGPTVGGFVMQGVKAAIGAPAGDLAADQEALRTALIVLALLSILGALCWFLATLTLRRDLERTRREDGAEAPPPVAPA